MFRTTIFARRCDSDKDAVLASTGQPGHADSEALLGDTALLHRARELNVLRAALTAAQSGRQPARRR